MTATILTVVGRKGGCGKSTLVTSMAGALAAAKQSVLVIDLDGQSSATRSLFGREQTFHPSGTAAALFERPETAPTDVIHPTTIEHISVVPSTAALDQFMIPHGGQNRGVLYPLLSTIREDFNVILIDTPPNTNAWPTYAALAISDWAMTPVIPDSFGAHATADTLRVINEVGRVRFLGFVFTLVERSRVTTEYKAAIRQKYKKDVFKTEILKAVAYRDAAASRLPITHLTPPPAAAKVVYQLVNEIANRTTRRSTQRKAA